MKILLILLVLFLLSRGKPKRRNSGLMTFETGDRREDLIDIVWGE